MPTKSLAIAPAARVRALLRSAGLRHGLVLGAAMLAAGVLDYLVSVVAGRWLPPVEFGGFVAVTALLQVLLSVATAMRMVVAFYTADLAARWGGASAIGPFLRGVACWCGRWGLAAGAATALASPLIARALHLLGPAPVCAAAAMVLMLFLREPAFGALQGLQAFGALGHAQVGQAALRLVLAMALIVAGAGAAGAVLAQPLAAVLGLGIAVGAARPSLSADPGRPGPRISRSYAVLTVVGLAAFGLLTNVDAVFVKMAFAPAVAGGYGTVVTFEKMSLFLPWAISVVLFPKATQRAASGQDPRPLLLVALAGVLAPGLVLSAMYLAAPGAIVRTVFTPAYPDPGVVLGLVSLAATLYAGVNVWLNFALSTGRTRFVQLLCGVVVLQASALWTFCRGRLVAVAITMIVAGVLGNVAGLVTAWVPGPARVGVPATPGVPPARRRRRAVTRLLALAGGALGLGYAVLVGSLDGLPFQDVPNHLARAVISADLLFDGGRRFGESFSFQPSVSPYVLHDLGFAFLVHLLGPYAAGRAWMTLVLLSLPAAVAVLLRALRCSSPTVLLGTILSLYLASDFTFVIGFTAYRLAVAITLLTLAAWRVYVTTGGRRWLAAYAAGVAAGYLMHLSATLFTAIGAAALAVAASRSDRGALVIPRSLVRRAVAGAVPLLAIAGWHVRTAGVAPAGATIWSPPAIKVKTLLLPFHRYDRLTEGVLLALFAAVLVQLFLRHSRAGVRRALVPAGVAAAFFATYAVLPCARSYVSCIDLRALPLSWLFVAVAALVAADRGRPGWAPALLVLGLVALNLGVLAVHLRRHDRVLREYREIAARVPEGVSFVPISTRPREGTTDPYLHAGNFAVVERAARSPYLFTGGVTSYFQAKSVPSAPDELWYQTTTDPTAGRSIAQTYAYLLVMKPFDRGRVPAPIRVVAENEAAQLLLVEPPASALPLPARIPPRAHPGELAQRAGGAPPTVRGSCGSTRPPTSARWIGSPCSAALPSRTSTGTIRPRALHRRSAQRKLDEKEAQAD